MNQKKRLTKKEVLQIAKLANLKISPAEVKNFQKQLADILAYADVLNEVKTDKVKPTSQVTGLVNVFREDKVEKSLTQKQALSNAPESYKGYFKVRAIL